MVMGQSHDRSLLLWALALVFVAAWITYPVATTELQQAIAIIFGFVPVMSIAAWGLYQLQCFTSGFKSRLFEAAHGPASLQPGSDHQVIATQEQN